MKRYTLRPLRSPAKFVFYGMLISWAVGIVHWGIVQSQILRLNLGGYHCGETYSGIWAIHEINEITRKTFTPDEWKQRDSRLFGISYGWPIRSIGVVAERGSKIWPNGRNERVFIGIDLSHLWKPLPFQQVSDRAFPLYPLIYQSLLSGMIYGTLLWGGLAAWRQYKRRSEVLPCAHCHYELAGNSSDRCPECGNTQTATVKANAPVMPS